MTRSIWRTASLGKGGSDSKKLSSTCKSFLDFTCFSKNESKWLKRSTQWWKSPCTKNKNKHKSNSIKMLTILNEIKAMKAPYRTPTQKFLGALLYSQAAQKWHYWWRIWFWEAEDIKGKINRYENSKNHQISI